MEGAELTVVDSKNLPSQPKVLFRIPDTSEVNTIMTVSGNKPWEQHVGLVSHESKGHWDGADAGILYWTALIQSSGPIKV